MFSKIVCIIILALCTIIYCIDDSVDDRPRSTTVQEYGTSDAGPALEEKERLERVNEMTEREDDSSGSENATPAAKKLRIRDDFRYKRSAEENETPEPTEPERKFRAKTDLRYKRSDEENETPDPTEPDTKFRWGEGYSTELKKMA